MAMGSAPKPSLEEQHPRFARTAVNVALDDTRVVLVNGARQSGKSTSVSDIANRCHGLGRMGWQTRLVRYVRPAITVPAFHDSDGAAIPYGHRWGMAGPPDDTFSVTADPGRFSPLHLVATALLTYLTETYDVAVKEDGPIAEGVGSAPTGVTVVKSIHLITGNPQSADLTVTLTSFPGIVARAGVATDLCWPSCGCDACDDDVSVLIDDIETKVLSIVEGRFGEALVRPWGKAPEALTPWMRRHSSVFHPTLAHWFVDESGEPTMAQSGPLPSTTPAKEARKILARLGGGPWHQWPLREGTVPARTT